MLLNTDRIYMMYSIYAVYLPAGPSGVIFNQVLILERKEGREMKPVPKEMLLY